MKIKEYQDISDCITGYVKIVIKRTKRGWAKPGTRQVTIPNWIQNQNIEYQYYYVIHELCHILANTHLHNQKFKNVEKYWLAEFGLHPVYGKHNTRAYPTILRSAAGQTMWVHPYKQ